MAAESHCITTIHITALAPSAFADIPSPLQGETAVRPIPVPRVRRIMLVVRVATAPPAIAPHPTAEAWGAWARLPADAGVLRGSMDYLQKSASKRMIGSGMPNSQSRMPRPMYASSNDDPRQIPNAGHGKMFPLSREIRGGGASDSDHNSRRLRRPLREAA